MPKQLAVIINTLQAFSFKFKQSGVSYEIALAIWENRVVHVNGPFLAGTTDIQIFRRALKAMVPRGKKVVADQGYKGERGLISLANSLDSAEVRNFKSRCRARQESYNRRLKAWSVLDCNFRHTMEQHKQCFMAINTISIVQLNNGSPLFDV
jgi:hypothetical protein